MDYSVLAHAWHYLAISFFSHHVPTPPHRHTFPTRRSSDLHEAGGRLHHPRQGARRRLRRLRQRRPRGFFRRQRSGAEKIDRKSTRLTSHPSISYAVFCLKKKKKQTHILNVPNAGMVFFYHT